MGNFGEPYLTTVASIAAVVELVAASKIPQKGFIKQEMIPLSDFYVTVNGALLQPKPQS